MATPFHQPFFPPTNRHRAGQGQSGSLGLRGSEPSLYPVRDSPLNPAGSRCEAALSVLSISGAASTIATVSQEFLLKLEAGDLPRWHGLQAPIISRTFDTLECRCFLRPAAPLLPSRPLARRASPPRPFGGHDLGATPKLFRKPQAPGLQSRRGRRCVFYQLLRDLLRMCRR